MSDPNKPVNRIPFETLGKVTAWHLPSLDDAKTVPTAQREAARRQKPGETVEEVAQAPVKPMTADDLQKIAAQAEQEGREHGYQQGYERGHHEGRRLGLETGQKKAYEEHSSLLQEQTARFKAICDALMDPLASQDQQLENTLVEMSIQIARHLINQAIDKDPAIIFNAVERAVESLPVGTENIQVFLHPDDLTLIHEHFPPAQVHWSLRDDGRLQRGGCKLVSQRSLVDYSIEHRLEQYLEQVREQGEPDQDDMVRVDDYRTPANSRRAVGQGSVATPPEPEMDGEQTPEADQPLHSEPGSEVDPEPNSEQLQEWREEPNPPDMATEEERSDTNTSRDSEGAYHADGTRDSDGTPHEAATHSKSGSSGPDPGEAPFTRDPQSL